MSKNLIGSQIAGGNSAYGRVESDFYPTPPEATVALLDYLNLPKTATIWEPACGTGTMADVFKQYEYNVVSTDISDQGYGEGGVNFLNTEFRNCDWIITNPPFAEAENFIKRCNEFCVPFALLLKSQYWHSKKRLNTFKEIQPSDVLPLTWRPDFLFKKRGKGAPLMDCIWCVWRGNSKNTYYYPLEKPAI